MHARSSLLKHFFIHNQVDTWWFWIKCLKTIWNWARTHGNSFFPNEKCLNQWLRTSWANPQSCGSFGKHPILMIYCSTGSNVWYNNLNGYAIVCLCSLTVIGRATVFKCFEKIQWNSNSSLKITQTFQKCRHITQTDGSAKKQQNS